MTYFTSGDSRGAVQVGLDLPLVTKLERIVEDISISFELYSLSRYNSKAANSVSRRVMPGQRLAMQESFKEILQRKEDRPAL